jgi:iron complex transport system ATP-binding protein
MLKAVDISKDYRGKKVLKNLDHEIINNKLIAYIGSNGAGKSTLLSILTRTLEIKWRCIFT